LKGKSLDFSPGEALYDPTSILALTIFDLSSDNVDHYLIINYEKTVMDMKEYEEFEEFNDLLR